MYKHLCFIVFTLHISSLCFAGITTNGYSALESLLEKKNIKIPKFTFAAKEAANQKLNERLMKPDLVLKANECKLNIDDESFSIYAVVDTAAKLNILLASETTLKTTVNLTNTYQEQTIPVRDAFVYCVAGAISKAQYKGLDVFMAYFEFGYSEEYNKLSEETKFPDYNPELITEANVHANSQFPTPEELGKCRCLVATENEGKVDLVILCAMENASNLTKRELLRDCVEELSSRKTLNQLIPPEEIQNYFPNHSTVESLLGSVADGAISISPTTTKEEKDVYQFCAYFRFKHE